VGGEQIGHRQRSAFFVSVFGTVDVDNFGSGFWQWETKQNTSFLKPILC
jgi:hypothetical protein